MSRLTSWIAQLAKRLPKLRIARANFAHICSSVELEDSIHAGKKGDKECQHHLMQTRSLF